MDTFLIGVAIVVGAVVLIAVAYVFFYTFGPPSDQLADPPCRDRFPRTRH